MTRAGRERENLVQRRISSIHRPKIKSSKISVPRVASTTRFIDSVHSSSIKRSWIVDKFFFSLRWAPSVSTGENRQNILVELDSAVGELAEGSSLLDLGGLLGVLHYQMSVPNFPHRPKKSTPGRPVAWSREHRWVWRSARKNAISSGESFSSRVSVD